MARRITSTLLLGLAGLTLLSGCGHQASYINRDFNFGYVRRCAVLPFQNLTPDRFADDRIQSLFVMEILQDGSLALVDPEETRSALRELQLPFGRQLDPEEIVTLGRTLSVEAVFVGTVEEYGVVRRSRSSVNQVTAVFGMAETETGSLIWQAHVHVDGSSFWKKLFGGQSASLYDISLKAVQRAVGTLL